MEVVDPRHPLYGRRYRPDYPTAPFSGRHLSCLFGVAVAYRGRRAAPSGSNGSWIRSRRSRASSAIELPIEEVRIGERVPADGTVRSGRSGVDQSLVTGESIPTEKAAGDAVIGGSINGTGTLVLEVTAAGEGSFLSQVIRHVEDARALKPGLLHLVDRVLRIYAPTVLVIAALSVIG